MTTTAGRSAAARRTPTRPPRTGPTPRTCTGCSRSESCPSYYKRDAEAASDALDRARCGGRSRRRCGSSRRRGCSTSTPSGCTCRPRAGSGEVRRRRGRVAGERCHESRGHDRGRLTERGPADLAGAHLPQPSAGRELRVGIRRGLRRRPTRRWSRRWGDIPASVSRSTTAARCWGGSSPSGPGVHRPHPGARGPRPGRDPRRRPVRAGPRRPAGAGPRRAARAHGGRRSRRVRDAADAAPGSRSASGSRICRRRSRPRVTSWTILDDAHFRAAAIPEDAMWGPYTTEDQGRLLTRLRDGAGPPLPDPVPRGRGGHRATFVNTRPRRRAGRDDGRRWREVRGVADDVRALLGRGPMGGAVLRCARGQRRLADHGPTPTDWLATNGPDRARLHPDRLVRGDGRMGAARRREGLRGGRPASRRGRGPAGGALAPRRVLAELPGQVPRDQRPPQADAARLGQGRGDGGRARSGTLAIDHLYRGQSNDCYWHGLFGGVYIAHMRAATLRAPDRRRGHRRHGRRAVVGGRDAATSTSTGRDEIRLRRARARSSPSISTRGPGIGVWDLRAVRHALTSVIRRRPEAYHETSARRGDRGAAASRWRRQRGRRPGRVDPRERSRSRKPGLADRLVYDDYERRAGLVRVLPLARDGHAWVRGRPRASSATSSTGHSGSCRLAPGPSGVARRLCLDRRRGDPLRCAKSSSGSAATGSIPPSSGASRSGARRRPADRRSARHRVGDHDARRRRQPGGVVGGRRAREAPRRHRRAASAVHGSAQGNGWLGVDVETSIERAGGRVVGADRDGLELGGRLRARLPGRRLLLSWPIRLAPGERWQRTVRHVVTTSRDRADRLRRADRD